MNDQDLKQAPPNKPDPEGKQALPLWTLLVGAFLVAVVGIGALGAFWYYARSNKTSGERDRQTFTNQQSQNDLAQRKAEADAKLALARNRQNEILVHVRNATNSLGRLFQEVERGNTEAIALKSNETGRGVARYPDLVAQARRLYQTELPQVPATQEIVTRLEGTRRIEQQLIAALGTAFEPNAEMAATIQGASFWAEQQLRKAGQVQALFAGLIQDAKVKVTGPALTASSPTLEAAMLQLEQDELVQRQKTILDTTKKAEDVRTKTLADAEAQRILEEARLKAEKMLSEARAAAEKQQRELDLKKAHAKVDDTKNQVAIDKAEEEARKLVLREKASQPDVKTKLAPFTTPGLWRPVGRPGELKPHSYTQLQTVGALNPTQEGRRKLVEIAYSTADKVRPRWNFGGRTTGWMSRPADVATVTEAQDLLIELGPVLVEMKLLEP